MSTLSRKIADEIPDSWLEYVAEHPRVLYAITVPLVAWCGYQFGKAIRVHILAELYIAERVGDVQRAASEALGG